MSYRHEFREIEREAKWTFWRLFRWGIFLVVLFGLLSIPLGLWSSARGVLERTTDPDNVIYNYEWFHSKYEAFRAYERQLADFNTEIDAFRRDAGERLTWSRTDREEYAQLTSQRDGIKQHCRDIAADYNARSSMANRSIFKSGDLPERIAIP